MKSDDLGPLPPGWDTKFDPRTGRYYYINHYTKSTSWEDPRVRYQQIGKPTSLASVSSLASKDHTSSPKPSGSTGHNPHELPAQLQGYPLGKIPVPSTSSNPPSTISNSQFVVHLPKSLSVTTNYTQDSGNQDPPPGGSPPYGASPLPLTRRTGDESPKSNKSVLPKDGLNPEGEAESSFIDPDLPVKNIAAMFPTVEESHIRTLLKNNCYLEIPTINQLKQDERRIQRLLEANSSQDKDELTYLKSVFPTVEEYLLLDVLSNSDNNVQKAADRLVKMGYVKRDTPSAPRLHARKKEEERLAEKRTPLPKPPPIKSDAEKTELRKKMVEAYEVKYDIPERILYMALESVLYDEDQANNLINSMIEDDLKRKKAKEAEKAKEKQKKKSPKPNRKSLEISTPSSPKKDFKKQTEKKSHRIGSNEDLLNDNSMITRGTSTTEDGGGRAKGPNPSICKGPNDGLLLKDYVTWNGPDPSHAKGVNTSLVSGPNAQIVSGSKSVMAKGHQESLAKGPQGLNRGSMYKRISPENESTRSS
eukprot:TRINITY_DN1705_c0_g1_i5.p1 TRINITY_DN1705_c0_g1~~TRINITY_DN1705_c0_g1_i5.p1  ORF type:complete len:533 (-),score=151.45 TRINITY_DN1705_c0_g1_i5:786-2384(-)